MEKKKIALLDTDFIFKSHISQSSTDHLIDKVLMLPEYDFYCHGQIVTELGRHTPDALQWLQDKIQNQDIHCYTDEMILDELEKIYGNACCNWYAQFLKEACDAFGDDHFANYYGTLQGLDYSKISKTEFLEVLTAADDSVGRQNSLGEIKTYVLLQTLDILNGEHIYMFCSDDQKARIGITQFDNVRCISILSAFLKLKNEIGLTKALAEPYRNSWLAFCTEHKQTTFRVLVADERRKFCKVPCAQVLDDIYDDKFVTLGDGFLKYKPST